MAEKSNKRKILVRGVNWIGDAVMTLPTLRVLRSAFHDEDIHLMVKDWVTPIFCKDPNIDGIVEYRREYDGITGKFQAARDIRRSHYDSAILFQNAFDAAILVYLAGVPERVGYNRDARGFLLTKAIAVTAETKRLHHTLYYLHLLRELGLNVLYRHPWIYLDNSEHVISEERLTILRRPIILLNPGATYGSAKRWPTEYFSSLSEMIIRDMGGSILIAGSEAERTIANEIISSLDKKYITDETVLNLSGTTSLRAFTAILSKVDTVVTNDSGPMHLAYAVGTPLIALFGSTDPGLTGSPSFVKPEEHGFESDIEFGLKDVVLKKKVECSPCFERECPAGDVRCLREITPEEVFNTILETKPTHKAIFFDRDGTLCSDVEYLARTEDLEIYPEVKRLIKLREKGYLLIGVSNQSGVARELVDREFVDEVNTIFVERYGFDDFYYCFHHPDEYCACRKPSPGMALKARRDFNIDFRSSIVVGDKESDMELARNIGAEGILVRTGKEQSSQYADTVLDDLGKVVDYILHK